MPLGTKATERVAIVGASTLLGKEVKEVLEERNFPAGEIVLLDDSVMAGTLTEAGGEATFIRPLEADSFDRVRFAFFTGSAADTQRNWQTAFHAGTVVIDMTGSLTASHDSLLRIPSLENGATPTSLLPGTRKKPAGIYSSPSTGVIIVCSLSAALADLSVRSLALVLFPPISDHDQVGVEELESQTASLLSFRPIAQSVFDAQVAFNLLSEYGQASKSRLSEARRAITRDVSEYLAGRTPVPAIQLMQAPVFYGYAFAAYAEFDSANLLDPLRAAMIKKGMKPAPPEASAPSNVNIAGEAEIRVGSIARDDNVERGVWISGVADNLRVAAINAVRIAEEHLAT